MGSGKQAVVEVLVTNLHTCRGAFAIRSSADAVVDLRALAGRQAAAAKFPDALEKLRGAHLSLVTEPADQTATIEAFLTVANSLTGLISTSGN